MRNRRTIALAALLTMSCTGDPVSDSGDDEIRCITPYSVVRTLPESGATNVTITDTIEVEFTDVDSSATLILRTDDDAEISGAVRWRDKTFVFTPDAPLTPETHYTAYMQFSCGDPSFDFTTTDSGKPLTVDITGRTYDMSLDGARILQPAGVQDLVESFLGTDVLAHVQSADGTLQMLGGVAQDDVTPLVQNECSLTVPFPSGDFSDSPIFAMGPADETFSIGESSVTVHDLHITGTFNPGGTEVHGITLSGVVDTRTLGAVISDNATEQTACNFADAAGVACEACPDGELYCITLEADRISASEVPGLTLVEVTDVCANDACSAEPECVDAEQ